MYPKQGRFHLEYKRRSLSRIVSSLVPSAATPTDTVKKEQLINQISDEDVMPSATDYRSSQSSEDCV
ncbi:hypothetical protein N7478_010188 [Penicillium angulare]|uniref:uncharacterized protein n=1 Tax=Penicillium angulare TaxID=116970 RepID=UPI00253FD815|nr:uncharacterized protein N7478_010188 [Penicillium angulare]KAJ5267380.1 hypothetical protein N7478_010188 [Penicillium angulare]